MSTNDLNLVPQKCQKFAAGDKLGSGYCLKHHLHPLLPGVTWLASDPDLNEDVALHFVPQSVIDDLWFMEELRAEVLKNRQLVHPRILRIHELVEEEGLVALEMEVPSGETLAHLLERKKFFECREIKEWLGPICVTIDDAHQGDLLHGDLSLENIRIKADGELALANFGVSRVIRDSLARSNKKEGKTGKKDPKSQSPRLTKGDDIAAIGAVLYQLLTGTPPKQSATGGVEYVPVSERRKEAGIKGGRILPEWEKMISLCLEKNAALRPKNAMEIAMRLGGNRPSAPAADAELVSGSRPNASPLPGSLAIRSTVKPGGRPGFETTAAATGITESPAESEDQPVAPSRPSPSSGKSQHYPTSVFMPVDRPLGQAGTPSRVGPFITFLVAGLILAALGGGGYLFISGRNSKTSNPALVANSSRLKETEAPATAEVPTPTPEATSTPSATAAAEPTALQPAAAVPAPAPSVAPEPPKMKILVEPQTIPEEQTKLVKTAKTSSSTIEEARAALVGNEKIRLEKQALQDKALADLKDAQAVAEKANAELLLKQAAAGDAAKALTDLTADSEAKQRAIKDAQAETARYQAVMDQIASLKRERAVETEVPASPEAAQMAGSQEIPPDAPDPSQAPAALPAAKSPSGASPAGQGTTNSLGMKFIPVGDVKFSIWLTRVQDFAVFAEATGLKSRAWKQPGFEQGPTHPVVNVSWKEASAFCRWLTQKEHKEGTLPANLIYRLPTDAEWSQAVGLPFEKGRSAQSRDMDVPGVYPWGTQWPPPPGTGNFTGEETGSDAAIKGYNDGFAWTSPVGSFPPNANGLYDMAGNAWQWCMDYWNEEQKARVLRGSSWCNSGLNLSLLSSCRFHAAPESFADNYSFRCVIAPEGYQ